METVNQILLVDNHVASNTQTDSKIRKSGLANKVKIALNGGHALLYLDQVSEKIVDSSMVILLNMDTPIMNGYEFITQYNSCKNLCRDRILVVVMNDNMNEERMNALRTVGISHFINRDFDPQILSGMIRKYFNKVTPPASVKMKNNKITNHAQLQSMRAA